MLVIRWWSCDGWLEQWLYDWLYDRYCDHTVGPLGGLMVGHSVRVIVWLWGGRRVVCVVHGLLFVF